LRVLVGPPHAGAEALVGGHDPGPTQAVGGPGEAAVPGWSLGGTWPAMIEDGDRPRRALWLRGVELREERVPVPPERDGPAVLYHAVDLERGHEVDLHLRRGSRGLEHPIGDAVRPPDTRVGRADGDPQVVEGHVPPRPPRGGVGAAQRIGVGKRAGLRGEPDGGAQQDEGGEGLALHIVRKGTQRRGLALMRLWPAVWAPSATLPDRDRRKAQMTLVKTPPALSQDVDLSKTYDAVVVGSGAAGGMAAHVLTEQGMDVLMLEAGKKLPLEQELRSMQWPYDQPPRGDAPPGYH